MFWLLLLACAADPLQSEKWGDPCCIGEPSEIALCLRATAAPPPASLPSRSGTAESSLTAKSDSSGRNLGAGDRSSRFRIGVHEVLVPVAVIDQEGHLVQGLEPQEFRLLEDGVEQRIDHVLPETIPFTVGIVVDVSGSMKAKMENTRLALSVFLDQIEPRDHAFLLAFNQFLRPVQDVKGENRRLRQALLRVEPEGGTALYDAVVEGLYRLHRSRARKRALVVLSDGMDNSSVNSARDAIDAAQATGIPIYAIGLGKKRGGFWSRLLGDPVWSEFREVDEIRLRELSARTGGRALFVADMKEKGSKRADAVAKAFNHIARELRSLYLLSYRPMRSELDGRWHNLEVEVLRPDLYTRFRPGYLAAPIR